MSMSLPETSVLRPGTALVLTAAVLVFPAFIGPMMDTVQGSFAIPSDRVDFDGGSNQNEDKIEASISTERHREDPAVTPIDTRGDDGLVWAGLPRLGREEGEACIAYTWVRLDPAEVEEAERRAWQAIRLQVDRIPESTGLPEEDCPVDPARELPPQVIGGVIRDTVTDVLPRPEPSVPPGYALTGMPAYLVTDHALDYGPTRHDVDLEVMQVTVEVRGEATTTVDWGDGSEPRTYDQPGHPYPDGQVVHTYTDTGTATVEITDTWRLTYDVYRGGRRIISDVAAFELAPVVLDLEIRELQTVRTNGG